MSTLSLLKSDWPNPYQRYVSGGTLAIDALVRGYFSELLFTQILEEVIDSSLMPLVVGVSTMMLVIGQGNTHEIERGAARLLNLRVHLTLGWGRIRTTVVSKFDWVVICCGSSGGSVCAGGVIMIVRSASGVLPIAIQGF